MLAPSWPAGVRLATLSAHTGFGVLGKTFPGTLTINADFGTVDELTWSATGETFLDLPDSAAAPGTVTFPHPAQAGWIDPAGNAVTDWALIATLKHRTPEGLITRTRRFTLLPDVDHVDFANLLTDDDASTPNTVRAYAAVDDTEPRTDTTYSSQRITELLSHTGGSGPIVREFTSSALWSIVHSLGRKPSVALYDAAGQLIDTDVFASSTLITATFPQPTSGTAVLT